MNKELHNQLSEIVKEQIVTIRKTIEKLPTYYSFRKSIRAIFGLERSKNTRDQEKELLIKNCTNYPDFINPLQLNLIRNLAEIEKKLFRLILEKKERKAAVFISENEQCVIALNHIDQTEIRFSVSIFTNKPTDEIQSNQERHIVSNAYQLKPGELVTRRFSVVFTLDKVVISSDVFSRNADEKHWGGIARTFMMLTDRICRIVQDALLEKQILVCQIQDSTLSGWTNNRARELNFLPGTERNGKMYNLALISQIFFGQKYINETVNF